MQILLRYSKYIFIALGEDAIMPYRDIERSISPWIIISNGKKPKTKHRTKTTYVSTSPWCWPYPQCTGLLWYTPWHWSRHGPTPWPVHFQKPPGQHHQWCCTAETWSDGWWDTQHMWRLYRLTYRQSLSVWVRVHVPAMLISVVLCVCTPPASCDCKSLLLQNTVI